MQQYTALNFAGYDHEVFTRRACILVASSEEVRDAEGDVSVIAECGAAVTAYTRLQFEDLSEQARARIRSALLRYCELDTLAMVMIVQAWQEMRDNA